MDTSHIIQLIVIVVLVALSAFFSSSETALTTVNKHKLRSLMENGNKSAAKVLKVTENSSKLLSTILIGNNIVNIYASSLTTTLFTEIANEAVGIATGVLTLVILIFGEISPKTLATQKAIGLSMVVVYPISFLMFVFTPAIWVLNILTGAIFKILRVDPNAGEGAMTESELRTIVNVSHEDGVIEQEEKFMISNVVDFGDALSKDVMIPRADIVCADVTSSYDELVKIFMDETYSRMPIYEDSKDHVIGILYLKDLFFYSETHSLDDFDVRKILRKPVFVHEYQKTSQIFADLKTSAVTMAIVLDEYGVTSGIITMEDLIEEIVGEIRDEYDDDEDDFIRKLSDNQYDIDASIKLDDLNDALDTTLKSNNYDSLGGLVIEILDKLPDEGEIATTDNITLKVTQVEKNRIERILLTINQPKESDNEA
ncbi:MAG: HlyC/CorC family transporter [Lachnospiraceae bacterium]|nr:HlyC/CorC family transporter [Lachnospiraceae bacterium]